MHILIFIIYLLYISCRLLKEEWGNGDFYRDMYRKYGHKADLKRANESDTVVTLSIMFLSLFGIAVLYVIFA